MYSQNKKFRKNPFSNLETYGLTDTSPLCVNFMRLLKIKHSNTHLAIKLDNNSETKFVNWKGIRCRENVTCFGDDAVESLAVPEIK